MLESLTEKGFDVRPLHHAEAILTHDMPSAVAEIEAVLQEIKLPVEEIVRGGGGEGQLTQRIRKALSKKHQWVKHTFEVKKIIDGQEREAISHEVDHVKVFGGRSFALEIEWNNKDPFFDRDLENFKRLHADGAISIGCIITRGESLQDGLRGVVERFARTRDFSDIDGLRAYYKPTDRQVENILNAVDREADFAKGWAKAFVADKFGEATTHWRKLMDRVSRGVGNPCPLLLIGIPLTVVAED